MCTYQHITTTKETVMIVDDRDAKDFGSVERGT